MLRDISHPEQPARSPEVQMSKASEGIRQGLEEALAYSKDKADDSEYLVHVPKRIEVRAIPTKLIMPQKEFAGQFGLGGNTLRHPERCKRPEGSTRAYLFVIGHSPKTLGKTLRAAYSLNQNEICNFAAPPLELAANLLWGAFQPLNNQRWPKSQGHDVDVHGAEFKWARSA